MRGQYFHQWLTIICSLWRLNRKNYIPSPVGKSMFTKKTPNSNSLSRDKSQRRSSIVPWYLDWCPLCILSTQGSLNNFLTSKFSVSYWKVLSYEVIKKEKYERDSGICCSVWSFAWTSSIVLCAKTTSHGHGPSRLNLEGIQSRSQWPAGIYLNVLFLCCVPFIILCQSSKFVLELCETNTLLFLTCFCIRCRAFPLR